MVIKCRATVAAHLPLKKSVLNPQTGASQKKQQSGEAFKSQEKKVAMFLSF